MRWAVLAALSNGWLWLLAVTSFVVLLVSPAPLWFAVLTGVAVILGGATAQGAIDWRSEQKRRRGEGSSAPQVQAPVSDPDARAVIARARSAADRITAVQTRSLDSPDDVIVSAVVAADAAAGTMDDLGRHVDRLNRALGAVNPQRAHDELRRMDATLARDTGAPAELTRQRQAIADGLRAQLAAHERLRQQRVLALTRMQSAAVGLEGLAVRLSEVAAMYSARHVDALTATEVASVATDIDELRVDLGQAEASLRQTLRSLD